LLKRITLVGLLFVGACGPDLQASCEAYISANNACVEEAMGTATIPDGALLDPEAACAVYDGVKGSAAKSQAKQLDCYATAIDGVDCSDSAAYATGVADALAGCPLE
jgi:hypothetical protein